MIKHILSKVSLGFAAVVLVMGLTMGEASAQEPSFTPGETITAGSYCNFQDDELIDKIAESIEKGGMGAYQALLNSDVPCFDVRNPRHRAFGVRPVQFELVEFVRYMAYLNGDEDPSIVEIWRVKDGRGTLGYTWAPHGGAQSEPEGDPA